MDLMEIYKWTAIVSGAAFLLQLLSTMFGFDSDMDTDTDADMSMDGGVDHGGADHGGHHLGFGNIFLSFISIRNVVSFFLAFSITGYFGMRDYNFGQYSLLPGIVAGLALVAFNMYLIRSLASIKRDTSVSKTELEGKEGLVIFPVLATRSGQGKINVTVSQKIMTLYAITDDPEDIPKNCPIIVEQVLEGWIVLVKRK